MINNYNDFQNPKFEAGEVVYEIGRPQQLMLVIRRNGLVYYCKSVENEKERNVAFIERDLKKKLYTTLPVTQED